ncbi:MAG: sugar phosphate isomerase/epimerase [Verrucomicrobiales bacterium]|nr:sugar phosphate isomerase/epimerase [Verrucomicrobiales bacterium]
MNSAASPLSLSVRIAEGFLSKEQAMMDLPSLARLAHEAGYRALCMRGSQLNVWTDRGVVAAAASVLRETGLGVTMVTGDFDIVYNNDNGPRCLRGIGPYLDLATALGASMVRVALRKEEDIAHARRAADEAAERGIRLVHQCHIQSLFEKVDGIVATLRAIDRPNFGLIYEAANLELCGQDYGEETVRRLSPWIFNVYLQNHRLHADGRVSLETWTRGAVRFDVIPISEPGGIDFGRVFDALAATGYAGPITVHQSAPESGSALEAARNTAGFLLGHCRRVGLAVGR